MWLNQTVQNHNKTTTLSSVTNSKIDCAKECPCGVPTIPVPDQWLEVMVTGGFKVWHIIFIIIAFLVTMIVIYCCFHRCRIPRTKQEIEADLMRSNLGTKFRDYLEELPNEPFTFTEALKKVQEIEEKLEQDDAQLSRELGARKRMGWIKLKGKEKEKEADKQKQQQQLEQDKDKNKNKIDADKQDDGKQQLEKESAETNGTSQLSDLISSVTKNNNQTKDSLNGPSVKSSEAVSLPEAVAVNPDDAKKENKQQSANRVVESGAARDKQQQHTKTTTTTIKRRRQKPNLSRTKLAKDKPLMVESGDNLERTSERSPHLEIPEPTSRPHKNPIRSHKKKLKSDKSKINERGDSQLRPENRHSHDH